jgi:hypothetical protein
VLRQHLDVAAIRTIPLADMVMCLDNVIAVAATAQGNFTLLMLGLAISIPLVVFGSTLMIRLMERWPAIVTLGAALIGWVAGETIANDHVLADFTGTRPWVHPQPPRGPPWCCWWAPPCNAARPPPPAPASAEPDRSSGNRFSTLLGGHLMPSMHMRLSTALHMSYTVSRATCTAVSASISTPVWPWVSTVAVHCTACSASSSSKSTATRVRARGWHRGIRSLVSWRP